MKFGRNSLARVTSFLTALLVLVAGCETTQGPPAPSPEVLAQQQRAARAKASLQNANKSYDAGAYDDALRGYLTALDTGALSVPDQIDARKHMAFVHCANGRAQNCKDQFERVLALDPAFDLAAAEASHPSWGPVFKNLKAELLARKEGRPYAPPVSVPAITPPAPPPPAPPPPAPRVVTASESQLAAGLAAYDAGDYPKALRSLQEAVKEPTSLSLADQIKARKHSAFIFCLTTRTSLCRAEFEKIFALDPNFDLAAAEAGHPSWGPSFRAVKSRLKQPPAKK